MPSEFKIVTLHIVLEPPTVHRQQQLFQLLRDFGYTFREVYRSPVPLKDDPSSKSSSDLVKDVFKKFGRFPYGKSNKTSDEESK